MAKTGTVRRRHRHRVLEDRRADAHRPEPGATSTEARHRGRRQGSAPNRGTRKGNIVNVEATVEALKSATEEAEVMAGVEIARAYVGRRRAPTSAASTRAAWCRWRARTARSPARTSSGCSRRRSRRPCRRTARSCTPSRRSSWSTSRAGSATRWACSARRLEVTVHLVTGNITRRKTLLTCVNRAGIEVVEMVFEPLATAEAVLTPDERELGALLIDIGAGTTGVRALRRTARSSTARWRRSAPATSPTTSRWCCARRSPRPSGSRSSTAAAWPSLVTDEEGISVPTVAGGTLAGGAAQARALRDPPAARRGAVQHGARGPGQERLATSACAAASSLTGGGAQLDGLLEIAEQIFDAACATACRDGGGSADWST